ARFLPFREQQAALHRAEVIEEQNAIEVIDLVLDGARLVAFRLSAKLCAVAVQRFDDHVRMAFDVAEDVGYRQAAFFRSLALAAADRDFVILDVDHFPYDPARREDLVAALERREQLLVLLLLAALRADENEVKDRDEQSDLDYERRRPRPTRAGGGERPQGKC